MQIPPGVGGGRVSRSYRAIIVRELTLAVLISNFISPSIMEIYYLLLITHSANIVVNYQLMIMR